MILLPSTRQRVANVPFLFRAHDCLDEEGIFALSYGRRVSGVFSRAGHATLVDQNGRLLRAASGKPRVQPIATGGQEGGVLLMEPGSVNLVPHCNDLRTASGWSVDPGVTVSYPVGRFAGVEFSRVSTYIGNGGSGRAISFTGDNSKAYSVLVKADGANTGYFYSGIYDSTATTYRCLLQIFVGAGGVVTALAATGALLGVRALGDGVYLVQAYSAGVTAANANGVYPVIDAGGATLSSVYVAGVQVEDAAMPTSLMPTGAATASRLDDSLYFPLDLATQALSFYVRGRSIGHGYDGGSYAWLANAGLDDPFVRFGNNGTLNGSIFAQWFDGANASNSAGPATAYGDDFEWKARLSSAGAMQLSTTTNGGAVTEHATGAAVPLTSAFATPTVLRVNTTLAAQGIVLASDDKTMRELRALTDGA